MARWSPGGNSQAVPIPLSSPEPLEFLVTFKAPLVDWLSIEGCYKALDPLPFASQFAIAKVANKVFATYSVLCNWRIEIHDILQSGDQKPKYWLMYSAAFLIPYNKLRLIFHQIINYFSDIMKRWTLIFFSSVPPK